MEAKEDTMLVRTQGIFAKLAFFVVCLFVCLSVSSRHDGYTPTISKFSKVTQTCAMLGLT